MAKEKNKNNSLNFVRHVFTNGGDVRDGVHDDGHDDGETQVEVVDRIPLRVVVDKSQRLAVVDSMLA